MEALHLGLCLVAMHSASASMCGVTIIYIYICVCVCVCACVRVCVCLVSLFNGISTLFKLFNAKAILLEEQ